MKTSVTELGDSRVRVDVGDRARGRRARPRAGRARAGARHEDARLPEGKGPAAARDPAGRPRCRARAGASRLAARSGTSGRSSTPGSRRSASPQLDVPSLPDAGEELAFSIEVAVRPEAKLGEYKGLEVGRPEAEVPDDAVDAELDRLREGFASLDPVDRAAADGDLAADRLLGHGRRRAIRGLGGDRPDGRAGGREPAAGVRPARSPGASAGDEVTVEVAFPDDHQPEGWRGKTGELRGQVKEVREKRAPRARRRVRLRGVGVRDARGASRRASRPNRRRRSRPAPTTSFARRPSTRRRRRREIDLPKELVHARAHEMWERLERSLSARGIDPQIVPPDAGQDARGDGRPSSSPTPSGRFAARRPWRRSPTPRRSR